MNDSLFQSTIVHLSQKTKKTQLQHYVIPQHNAKQLYDAYQGLLNQKENKEKVIELLEKAGITHIHKFYDGPCKYEGLHIPGPGLCWRNVISPSSSTLLKNNTVVLIETNFELDPIYWYFIELKENMTSSSACAALLIDRMINSHHHHHHHSFIDSKSSPSPSSFYSNSSSFDSSHPNNNNNNNNSSSSNESSSSSSNSTNNHHLHHHQRQHHFPFSFHSLLNKSKKHSNDSLLFIIGCPLPIQTNENEPITYLG